MEWRGLSPWQQIDAGQACLQAGLARRLRLGEQPGELFERADHAGGSDLVEVVVRGHADAVLTAQDANLGLAQGEPLEGLLPGWAKHNHGDADGAPDMHGSGVDGDHHVGEGEHGGEHRNRGLAGERNASGGGAQGFDGGAIGSGADEDECVAKLLPGMAEHFVPALRMPAGALPAAVLRDKDEHWIAVGAGRGKQSASAIGVGFGVEDFRLTRMRGCAGELGQTEIVFDEAAVRVVAQRRLIEGVGYGEAAPPS